MVKEGLTEKIEQFVESGGTFVTTFMSGIVDQSDNVHLGGYPGPLRNVLGIWAEEIDALAPDKRNQIKTTHPYFSESEYTCRMLCDLIHTEGAEVIAEYDSDFYKGMPAVTKHTFGKGEAWYVGTVPEADMLNRLVGNILDEKNIQGFDQIPEGVEISKREKAGKVYYFVMNHTEESQQVTLPLNDLTNILTDEKENNILELKAFDVKVLIEG